MLPTLSKCWENIGNKMREQPMKLHMNVSPIQIFKYTVSMRLLISFILCPFSLAVLQTCQMLPNNFLVSLNISTVNNFCFSLYIYHKFIYIGKTSSKLVGCILLQQDGKYCAQIKNEKTTKLLH